MTFLTGLDVATGEVRWELDAGVVHRAIEEEQDNTGSSFDGDWSWDCTPHVCGGLLFGQTDAGMVAKPVCGDDLRRGGESCDGSDLDGLTCGSFGFSEGVLACDPSCQFDTTGCTSAPAAACGDDVVEDYEECDGTSDSACPGACSAQCACPSCAETRPTRPRRCERRSGARPSRSSSAMAGMPGPGWLAAA